MAIVRLQYPGDSLKIWTDGGQFSSGSGSRIRHWDSFRVHLSREDVAMANGNGLGVIRTAKSR